LPLITLVGFWVASRLAAPAAKGECDEQDAEQREPDIDIGRAGESVLTFAARGGAMKRPYAQRRP